MKINPVNSFIAVVLSALLAYALWSIEAGIRNYVAVGTFVFCAGTLLPLMGGSYGNERRGINLRVVSGIFLGLGLAINVVFPLLEFSATAYIIVSALTFLVYAFVANSNYGTQQ